MRKGISAVLCLCLLVSLCGCSFEGGTIRFYYTRQPDQYVYGQEDAVFTYETREVTGHEDDLTYLLTLYLEGPLEPELSNPFPEGTSLVGFTYSDATLYVTLNDSFAHLEDLKHTIASACLAYTCFELTAAEYVVIKCDTQEYGNRSIKLSRASMILQDTVEATSPTEMTP